MNEVAFLITTHIVRKGWRRVVEVSITDGADTWTFDTVGSFTIEELKRRFPFFNSNELTTPREGDK